MFKNEAVKARWANVFTMIVSLLTAFQGTLLTHPPFTEQFVYVAGVVFTYLIMGLTAWKQVLSPDVNNNGAVVTFWVAVIATVAGLTDLIGIFHFNENVAQYVKVAISTVVMVLNIGSKQFFPSEIQKDKMIELKQQPSIPSKDNPSKDTPNKDS